MRVAVLGAGLMGAQIGCEYALGDHDVVLHSRDVEVARARAEAGLSFLREQGLRSADEVRAASARLETAATAKEAANGAALIVESLPESLELKVSIVRAALAETPDAVVATNTSSLSISALGEAVGVPEKTVGTHYLNPPLLMPPVEIVAGERTAPETVEFVRKTVASLGKLPIAVGRDVTGFIWNRLQFALVRECAWLIANGVASREDVDAVMREGLARRWRRVGPLRAIALGGVETWNLAGRNIVPELSNERALPDLARIAIIGGDQSRDAVARDVALARELRSEAASAD